jgi:type 1 glutamine amidotransferase
LIHVDITEQNLQQYDAIFLASTTGTFLDDPADPAVTAARRKALLDFVRAGKGLAGIVRLPRPFSVVDEVYTFNDASWSRARAHVLTSIDYAKMPAEVKAQEPAPQRADHDCVLSYIQREGKGRVFVKVLGHDESIYKMLSRLAPILAGLQHSHAERAECV